jgi:hypothetical protein
VKPSTSRPLPPYYSLSPSISGLGMRIGILCPENVPGKCARKMCPESNLPTARFPGNVRLFSGHGIPTLMPSPLPVSDYLTPINKFHVNYYSQTVHNNSILVELPSNSCVSKTTSTGTQPQSASHPWTKEPPRYKHYDTTILVR